MYLLSLYAEMCTIHMRYICDASGILTVNCPCGASSHYSVVHFSSFFTVCGSTTAGGGLMGPRGTNSHFWLPSRAVAVTRRDISILSVIADEQANTARCTSLSEPAAPGRHLSEWLLRIYPAVWLCTSASSEIEKSLFVAHLEADSVT